VTLKEDIEKKMQKAGIPKNAGEGWEPIVVALRAKERADRGK